MGNFELRFTEAGVEPAEYSNISVQEWWQSFYQYLVKIEASELGSYFLMEHDPELDCLVEIIESEGGQFYSDQYGVVKHLSFGDNSSVISNISYFRLLDIHSLSASRRLEFLIEKGVEVSWEDIPDKIRSKYTLDGDSEDQPTTWILYRFKISRLIDDQRGLFNRAFTLSCDRYYCFTGVDRTRRVLLAEGNRRYGDLIIPQSEGFPILDRILKNAISAYHAHYKTLK
ncbi:MAG: hypothetical protein JSV47_08960 [Deltaproteobacteria bacterium]|nr:MAG: hypothetical protein JSV47_08960 [Deltaproteobacteria bacterium]